MELTFLGAAGEVTGSKTLVSLELNERLIRYCVDYGMFQGDRQAAQDNLAAFPIEPKALDFVLLTHAHIDHSGLLPRLCAQGYNGPIYCTPATEALLGILLLDSAHIQAADADRALRKHRHGHWHGEIPEVLYTTEDVEKCLSQIRTVSYDVAFTPVNGVEITFVNAGHILGAASIFVDITQPDETKHRTVFSGDLGSQGQPLLRNAAPLERADVLVVESTYGSRQHRPLADTEIELVQIVTEVFKRHGNIVIPAFAAGRTQEVLFLLSDLVRRQHLPHLNIWIDSPMASAITRLTGLYAAELNESAQRCHQWLVENPDALSIRLVADVEESKSLNQIKGGAIIISASGMCDAGRIQHHLLNNLGDARNAVLITGFQAKGTLGRQLVDGARTVRILGHEVVVRASVHTIGGLSAHADQADLLRWLGGVTSPPAQTFITHGEPEAATALQEAIRERLGWERVSIPLRNCLESISRQLPGAPASNQILDSNREKGADTGYRRLFETAQDGILLADWPDGVITDANPFFLKMIDHTYEQVVGKKLWELGLLADKSAAEAAHKELIRYGYIRYEHLDLRAKDGRLVPVEFVSNVYKVRGKNVIQCNVRDITARRVVELDLSAERERRSKLLNQVIKTLGSVVAGRDPYTAHHQHRVADLACAIASDMRLSPEVIQAIRVAALVHDIGKITIPIDILTKPSALSQLEVQLLQTHAKAGFEILKEVDFPWPVAEIVLQHHERMDGSGYPNGLKGDNILIEARVIAVADMVEAMSSQRPYRPPISLDNTLKELETNRHDAYDSAAVASCLKLFRSGEFSFTTEDFGVSANTGIARTNH